MVLIRSFAMKKKRRSASTRRGEPTRRQSKLPPRKRPKMNTERSNINTKEMLMVPTTLINTITTVVPSNDTKARLENYMTCGGK